MANEEQLSILRQGVDVWNKWREENPDVEVDLIEADLRHAILSGVNFYNADLLGADLSSADLSGANLVMSALGLVDLYRANLTEANLTGASISGTDLWILSPRRDWFDVPKNRPNLLEVNLTRANLSEVDLSVAYLRRANLSGTNLQAANLIGSDLIGANFTGSIFLKARIGATVFGNSDLSEAVGLDDVLHDGPSYISTDIFTRSKGKIPDIFLRGCGLPEWEIESAKLNNPELSNEEANKILYRMYDLRANKAIQISPLFISYAHADGVFVDKLESQLGKKGIRFWRDIHDMKSGRMERQIDRAMHLNPTVLLILSEHSLQSDWVEHEVRTARALEKEMKRDVLCPVALDSSWKNSPWAKRIMEQIMEYNILDFSEWKNDSKFEGTFKKLIDGLELFYK